MPVSSSPAIALQTVIHARLTALLPVVPKGGHPIPSQPLPYISYGETDTTDSPVGHDIFLDLHFWSDADGKHIVEDHMQALRADIHGTSYTQNGWSLTCIRERDTRTLFDDDGQVWHGVMTLTCMAVIA